MEDSTEPVAHLGLPLAIAGAGGAAVVASMTRWWLLGPLHGPVAMIVAAATGGLIGTLLTQSLRCDSPAVTARKVIAFIVLAAPLTALMIALVCDPNEASGDAVLLGTLFAAALLPAAFVVVQLARAAQRSRVKSVVGRSDRRAAWRTTATWLALASAIGSVPGAVDGAGRGFLSDLFWWTASDKALLMYGPLFVSLGACVIASVVAVLDWRAERIVTHARIASGDWRLDETATEPSAALDVGIGHDTWMEHVTGRTTYRENAHERIAALGDLRVGAELLIAATRRSAIALAIAFAADVATLYVYARLL